VEKKLPQRVEQLKKRISGTLLRQRLRLLCDKSIYEACLDKNGPIRADYIYGKPFMFNDCKNLIQDHKNNVEKKNAALLVS